MKFVRIASSRGIEIIEITDLELADSSAANFDASPIDLGLLESMDFDLRRRMMQGFVP